MKRRSRLKPLLDYAAGCFGYALVPKWLRAQSPLAGHLARLFDLLAIDCVLDVGANRGQYRNFLRNEVGYKGPLISFEPLPEAVAHMSARSSADPEWIIQPYALGASPGEVSFNVMAHSVFSSVLMPDSNSVPELAADNTVSKKMLVSMKTLDQVFATEKYRAIYLKLDTQGYDLEVLKGAVRTLRAVSALQTEVSVTPLYVGMPDYVTSLNTLKGLGYELSGIFSVNDATFPRMVEFDAVMVRRDVR